MGDKSPQAVDASLVPEPDLNELTQDAFTKIGDYLNGELESVFTARTQYSVEDYTMLEKMNKISIDRYHDLRNLVSGVNDSMQQLKCKYEAVQQYVNQINEIEQAVESLEQTAYQLDAYSKQLEARFKELEKQ